MPSNRAEPATVSKRNDRFEGVIAGHRFSIAVDGGEVIGMQANAWTWQVGDGTLDVTASGPVDASTQFLVERSPRTIVRSPIETGLTIVTEVVVTAGGRMFTCVHQQRVTDDRTPEATAIRERGVAACSTLHVDP
ncbi:MAG: hypothetical protein WKG01_03900 [Kofleriaceae bacterium]